MCNWHQISLQTYIVELGVYNMTEDNIRLRDIQSISWKNGAEKSSVAAHKITN